MGELSPLNRDLDEFVREGGTEAKLLGPKSDAVSTAPGKIFVHFTNEHGQPDQLEVSEFQPLKNLWRPLAELIAQRATECSFFTLNQEIKRLYKFVEFLEFKQCLNINLREISNELLTSYCNWINGLRSAAVQGTGRSPYAAKQSTGGAPLSVDYKREIYRVLVLVYLRRIRLMKEYTSDFDPQLDLFSDQVWTRTGRKSPISILTRPQLKMLVRLCREEVTATTARLRAAWAIKDGIATAEDYERVDSGVVLELFRMERLFRSSVLPNDGSDGPSHEEGGLPPPCRDEFRKTSFNVLSASSEKEKATFRRKTFPILWAMNGPEYQDAVSILYPTIRLILPFCVLFAVYFRYNPSVLAGLRPADLARHPGALSDRIHGTPFKNRAGRKQHASWPVTTDAHNPAEMLKTLERWTTLLRPSALETEKNHLFLIRNNNRSVRSMNATGAFARSLSLFVKEHQAKLSTKFTMRAIRPSVIDLVHHLFDGDVVRASHAGQHRKVDTTIEHYLMDGARKRNDENLVPAVHGMNRWVETIGVIDPRKSSFSSDPAATPGWKCKDPYAGHIPGEEPEHLCRAYGRCVDCELGETDFDSPTSYALNMKLLDAMNRARTTMPEHAWLERWMPLVDRLQRTLILDFSEAAKASADLDIPDLPTVE